MTNSVRLLEVGVSEQALISAVLAAEARRSELSDVSRCKAYPVGQGTIPVITKMPPYRQAKRTTQTAPMAMLAPNSASCFGEVGD